MAPKPPFVGKDGVQMKNEVVKGGQLEEDSEAPQPDPQTSTAPEGPGLKIKLCQLDSE